MLRIATFCLIFYWIAIFVATHLPGSVVPHVYGSDKVQHAIVFSGLAFLLSWAIPTRSNLLRHSMIVTVIALAYACLDELTQNFIPGRSCDIRDWIADAVGAGCGVLAYVAIRRLLCGLEWGKRLIQTLSH